MSIFREGFNSEIKTQLTKREDAMLNRTTENIQYINSRNAWVRMCSSVEVNNDKGALAKAYVLHGGTLNDGSSKSNWSFKTGIGSTGTEAYSTKTPGGQDHKLGIRPMPGITSIDVKSKSAYGSLREITVNFQCWDIHQLEELELLYMRPGYTVLVEWGWAPYLDNTKGYQSAFNDFYSDDLLNNPPSNRSTIFETLYNRSITYGGNYDAMFGYIKNYNWSARPDGGYDCQTIVISTGEIIESLKVNYVRPDLKDYGMYDANGKGFLNDLVTDGGVTTDKYRPAYEKNTLAGIWSELYFKFAGSGTLVSGQKPINSIVRLPFPGTKYSDDNMIDPGSQNRVYTTLESVFNIINEYVIARSNSGNKEELIKLSTKTNAYSSKSKSLTCVAHPLQISTDPLVCLIKNKTVWEDKILTSVKTATAPTATTSQATADQIASELVEASDDKISAGVRVDDFKAAIAKITDGIIYKLVDDKFKSGTLVAKSGKAFNTYSSNGLAGLIEEQFIKNSGNLKPISPFKTSAGNNIDVVELNLVGLYYIWEMQQSLSSHGIALEVGINNPKNISGAPKNLTEATTGVTPDIWFNNLPKLTQSVTTSIGYTPVVLLELINGYTVGTVTITPPSTAAATTATTLVISTDDAIATIKNINTLAEEYFLSGNYDKEIGVIGNIYICLDFLYKLAVSGQMEAQDSKEKQEINLYTYVKNIASGINAALGSVSNFEVHVDPVDNIGRIIDVNYCEPDKKAHSLHEFHIQTLNSVIRNFKLESKIFPNQSAIVAIGAQASGGQLGIQNNTMVDYNNTLTDRVLKGKTFPKNASALDNQKTKPSMASSLANIVLLLSVMNQDNQGNSVLREASSRARNSLRDLIVYFQSITTSPSANRNIIPTKLSFEMDGIGGLVIGQLFKIDQSILPKGYKGLKGELAQTITGINHSISNGDWKTNIDSLALILDNIVSGFSSLDIKDIVSEAIKLVIAQGITPTVPPGGTPGTPGPPGTPPVASNPNPGKNDPLAGSTHYYSDVAAVNFMLTHWQKDSQGKPLPPKTRTLNSIRQLVLHHTNGYGNGVDTFIVFQDNRKYDNAGNFIGYRNYWDGIHYSIDRGGGVAIGVPLTTRVIHADGYNDYGVGIEICNLGALIRNGNIFTPDEDRSRHYATAPTNTNPHPGLDSPSFYCPNMAKICSPTMWGGEVFDFGAGVTWQGEQYYEEYTDSQIKALKEVIEKILVDCPNIKLNYDRGAMYSILYNVFGINQCKTNIITSGYLPPGNYKSARGNARYNSTTSGIQIHGTSPGGQHSDTHPTPKLVNMLKHVNWPAKNLDPKIY